MMKKAAVFAPWRFDAAHGPAVNAGRGHPRKKAAVKTRIPRLEGEVAVVISKVDIGVHVGHVTPYIALD